MLQKRRGIFMSNFKDLIITQNAVDNLLSSWNSNIMERTIILKKLIS